MIPFNQCHEYLTLSFNVSKLCLIKDTIIDPNFNSHKWQSIDCYPFYALTRMHLLSSVTRILTCMKHLHNGCSYSTSHGHLTLCFHALLVRSKINFSGLHTNGAISLISSYLHPMKINYDHPTPSLSPFYYLLSRTSITVKA